eukprot:gene65563-89688_t
MAGQSVARVTAGPTVVRIELPEAQAQALKVGDEVQLAAEDLRGIATRGRVTQIYPSVTAGQVVADVSAPGLPEDLIGQRVASAARADTALTESSIAPVTTAFASNALTDMGSPPCFAASWRGSSSSQDACARAARPFRWRADGAARVTNRATRAIDGRLLQADRRDRCGRGS